MGRPIGCGAEACRGLLRRVPVHRRCQFAVLRQRQAANCLIPTRRPGAPGCALQGSPPAGALRITRIHSQPNPLAALAMPPPGRVPKPVPEHGWQRWRRARPPQDPGKAQNKHRARPLLCGSPRHGVPYPLIIGRGGSGAARQAPRAARVRVRPSAPDRIGTAPSVPSAVCGRHAAGRTGRPRNLCGRACRADTIHRLRICESALRGTASAGQPDANIDQDHTRVRADAGPED